MAAISNQANHLRDASFSSYLDTIERDFVENLVQQSWRSSYPANTPSRESISSTGIPFRRRNHRGANGELGVFGTEQDDEADIKRDPRAGKDRKMKGRKQKKNCSPNCVKYSEESSWNSQTSSMFPQDMMSRNNSQTGGKLQKLVPFGLRVFSVIQCKGSSCLDVDPRQLVKRPSRIIISSSSRKKNTNRDGSFTFPVLSSKISRDIVEEEEEEEQRKDDIEVFGLHKKWHEKDKIVKNLERKLSALTWDAIPRTIRSGRGIEEEDTESNASSDLFEIPVFPASMMMSPVAGQSGLVKFKEFSGVKIDVETKRLSEEEEWKGVVGRIRRNLGGQNGTRASDNRKHGQDQPQHIQNKATSSASLHLKNIATTTLVNHKLRS